MWRTKFDIEYVTLVQSWHVNRLKLYVGSKFSFRCPVANCGCVCVLDARTKGCLRLLTNRYTDRWVSLMAFSYQNGLCVTVLITTLVASMYRRQTLHCSKHLQASTQRWHTLDTFQNQQQNPLCVLNNVYTLLPEMFISNVEHATKY